MYIWGIKTVIMKKITLLILFFFSINFVQAQKVNDTIKLFVPEIDSVCSSSFVFIPVKAINFRNIVGVQGTIKWDSTILKLDSVFINHNVPYFDSLKVDTNFNVKNSFITFFWADGQHNLTLNDSTTLFRLRCKILKSSQISSSVYFDNAPTMLEVDTAADLSGFSDLASFHGNVAINGKINFIDTPTIVQNGNVFTCNASCLPQIYIWYIYDCNGNLIQIDSTLTNTYTSTQSTGSCYIVQCSAHYINGVTIKSQSMQNILPLKLLSFTTKLHTQKTIILNWQTTAEFNVVYINVQRSINGKDFTTIGKVNAKCCEYTYTDNSVPLTADSKLYYRLEITDKDGSKTYSEIKPVDRQLSTVNGISIFPNPAKDMVTIDCSGAKELLIIDYLGQIVKREIITNQLSIINVNQLAKGMYIVKTTMKNGEIKTEKLIVE